MKMSHRGRACEKRKHSEVGLRFYTIICNLGKQLREGSCRAKLPEYVIEQSEKGM
jgi:hypothetical protein